MKNRNGSEGHAYTVRWQLREFCAARGISVRTLFHELQRRGLPISRATTFRIFELKRIPLNVIAACCAYLKCKPGDLFVFEITPPALRPPPTFDPPGVH
jgi:DNA-binding Xre family transcriptional regulator